MSDTRARIETILQRELAKLDAMSATSPEPLPASEIRSLDTLIKAFRTFVAPDPAPKQPDPADPASISTESLLDDVSGNAQT